jgi:hypothetical protein
MYGAEESSRDLAGTYHLVQVQTQPNGPRVSGGTLHLQVAESVDPIPDSVAHIRGPLGDLVGWYEPVQADSLWRAIVQSRDPARPGARLSRDRLTIGMNGALDGFVDAFTITAQSRDGMWGWWIAETGFAVPAGPHPLPARAGYFCAYRLNPTTPAPGA